MSGVCSSQLSAKACIMLLPALVARTLTIKGAVDGAAAQIAGLQGNGDGLVTAVIDAEAGDGEVQNGGNNAALHYVQGFRSQRMAGKARVTVPSSTLHSRKEG